MLESIGKVFERSRKCWIVEERQGNQPHGRRFPAKQQTWRGREAPDQALASRSGALALWGFGASGLSGTGLGARLGWASEC